VLLKQTGTLRAGVNRFLASKDVRQTRDHLAAIVIDVVPVKGSLFFTEVEALIQDQSEIRHISPIFVDKDVVEVSIEVDHPLLAQIIEGRAESGQHRLSTL